MNFLRVCTTISRLYFFWIPHRAHFAFWCDTSKRLSFQSVWLIVSWFDLLCCLLLTLSGKELLYCVATPGTLILCEGSYGRNELRLRLGDSSNTQANYGRGSLTLLTFIFVTPSLVCKVFRPIVATTNDRNKPSIGLSPYKTVKNFTKRTFSVYYARRKSKYPLKIVANKWNLCKKIFLCRTWEDFFYGGKSKYFSCISKERSATWKNIWCRPPKQDLFFHQFEHFFLHRLTLLVTSDFWGMQVSDLPCHLS